MIDYICSFIPHKRSKDDELAHLQCRLLWDGCRRSVSINVGFLIDPAKWDPAAQRCRPKSRHGRNGNSGQMINNEIVRFERAASVVFGRFDRAPNADAVRGAMRAETGVETRRERSIDAAYDDFVSECSRLNSWTYSTVQKMMTARAHMRSYGGFKDFGCFDEAHLGEYLGHLVDEGLGNTSIGKLLGYLRWFLHWAEGKGYLTDRSYAFFRPRLKTAQRPVVFLTWDELMLMWDWKPTLNWLGTVRDIFCFCCFTSLRYSDAAALRWSDVESDCLHVVTKKTTDRLTIDLNKWSEELLKRYVETENPGGTVFPRVTNQVMNRALKVIAKDCGIRAKVTHTFFRGSRRSDETHEKWELMGTHAGRRTFICNALMMGIPPTTVMQWTGHSDYRAMKPYIAVADAERARSMRLFDAKR